MVYSSSAAYVATAAISAFAPAYLPAPVPVAEWTRPKFMTYKSDPVIVIDNTSPLSASKVAFFDQASQGAFPSYSLNDLD